MKNELEDAGVNRSVFKAHSGLSASSSKEKDIGVSLNEILKRDAGKLSIQLELITLETSSRKIT